jgi:hypothetical protein
VAKALHQKLLALRLTLPSALAPLNSVDQAGPVALYEKTLATLVAVPAPLALALPLLVVVAWHANDLLGPLSVVPQEAGPQLDAPALELLVLELLPLELMALCLMLQMLCQELLGLEILQ